MTDPRLAHLKKGLGSPSQVNPGTLRHNAREAQILMTGQKPSEGVYKTPGRGAQGESSN